MPPDRPTQQSRSTSAGTIVFPLVREMAATGATIRVPVAVAVAVACRVLGLSTQGYYTWLKNPVSQRDWDDAHLIDSALDIHGDDPGYGYRFITDELADVASSRPRTGCGGCARSSGSSRCTRRNGA